MGLRINSGLISPATYDPDLEVLADKTGLAQAVKVKLKYLGNAIIQGATDVGPWETISAAHTRIRFSTDGGTTWLTMTVPSGAGIVTLLSALVGVDRLSVLSLKDFETAVYSMTHNSIKMDTTPTGLVHTEGQIYWDTESRVLSVDLGVAGVSLQMGLEMYVYVRNVTGSTITNGQVVYVTGATGQTPTIALAQANAANTSRLIGMATADIANNSFGYVTTFGIVRDIDTSAFAEGNIVYLSESVAGGLTATAPDMPNYAIMVGSVLYAHASTGKICIRPGLDWSNLATFNNLNINGTLKTMDIVTTNTNYHYFGASATDGSWRVGLVGGNFVIEKRVSGSWVTKQTLT